MENQKWTAEQEARLANLWSNRDYTLPKLADALGTTISSIRHKAVKLNLGPHTARKWVNSQIWPEAKLLKLKQMWAEGYSASQIGNELGHTRNSVIGKAHRMKLPGRKARIPEAKARVVNAEARRAAPKVYAVTRKPKEAQPPTIILPEPDDGRPGLTIMELRSSSCRAVIRMSYEAPDKVAHYCGETCSPGQSFCPTHQAIYYKPYFLRRQSAASA